MLERFYAYLRKGGLNSIDSLKAPDAFSHTDGIRKANFWSHGAFLIDLPCWWQNLLHNPLLSAPSFQRPPTARSNHANFINLQRLFQDLTRPIHTLASIRKINRCTIAHQHAVRSIQKRSRNFNSIACALLNTSGPSKPQHDGGYGSNIAADCGKSRSEVKGQTRLDSLLEVQDWSSCRDQVWEHCQQIVESGQVPTQQSLSKLFNRLSSSESQSDTERVLALFGSLPPPHRRAVYYSFATTAALKLNEVDTAIQLHHEAMARLKSPASASKILRHTVSHTNWDVAVAIWQAIIKHDSSQNAGSALWAEMRTLPIAFLLKRALTLTDFAVRDRYAMETTCNLNTRFCLDFLRNIFSIRANQINIKQWASAVHQLKLLANSEHQDAAAAAMYEALQQMLSFDTRNCDLAALNAFLSFRETRADIVLAESIYMKLFGRCSSKHDALMIQRLVQDWRNTVGPLEVGTYRTLLRTLAKEGHEDLFNKVYELYRSDHSASLDPLVAKALLDLYYRRADVEGAVTAFAHIEAVNGERASIELNNTVMLTFARVGDIARLESWFRTLEATGLQPDATTFFALLWPHSKRGDCVAVQSLMKKAHSLGIEQDVAMFNMTILALVNNGELGEAEKRVEEWSSNDLLPKPVSAWNSVLHAYALSRDLVKVKNLHNRMYQLGIASNSRTYDSLIRALCTASFSDEARKLVLHIMPRLGMQPSEAHYAAVMRGYMHQKQYAAVFSTFDVMIGKGIEPNLDSRNVILRTLARQDWDDNSLYRARRALDWIMKSIDPAELANLKSTGSVGTQRLDDAFVSSYFGYMLAEYGVRGAFEEVSRTYKDYVETAGRLKKKDMKSPLSLNIVSALLASQHRAGNHEEVERCWYLALRECEASSRMASTVGSARSPWVLPHRKLIINLPLRHYMRFLSQQGRYTELNRVVKGLIEDGYELSLSNWNQYIRFLCASRITEYQVQAFELCEQKLMHDWNGWGAFSSPNFLNKRIQKSILRRHRIAEYATLVWLTRAWIDLGHGRSKGKGYGSTVMPENVAISKTLAAVQSMPRVTDKEQNTIL